MTISLDDYQPVDNLRLRGHGARQMSRARMKMTEDDLARVLGVSVEMVRALEHGVIDVARTLDDGLLEVPFETMNATTRKAVDGYKRFLRYAEVEPAPAERPVIQQATVSTDAPARAGRVDALRRGLTGETATYTANRLPEPFRRVQALQSIDVRPSELAEATDVPLAAVVDFLSAPVPKPGDTTRILSVALRWLASGPTLTGGNSKSEERAWQERLLGTRR